ncbi:MAG: SRPBCC family protein [Actinobacteria bacterium]|nr:SRPBCC family protein [Actinomycetota bacterium]MCG2801682.1 SRPBCC family protein [Cellulomonas sp.]
MREARVVRRLAAPASRVWPLLVDARNHAAWIPLTRVEADGPPGVGTQVVAVSGPGATRGGPGLVDRMVITRLDPPGPGRVGVAVFTKRGPVLAGEAVIELAETGDTCLVRWTERVHLAGRLPAGFTATMLAPALDGMLRLALARATGQVEARRTGAARP